MRKAAGLAAAIVVIGAGATAFAISRSRTTDAATAPPKRLSTATVTKKDLVTYDETTATLGFTTSITVSSPVTGTVTTVAKAGDTIDAGSVVATVDGLPVVALIGDVPGYRDLSATSGDGIDVRQLEMNLVALGFDPDGAIDIDESFDKATTAAVKRWQADLGVTQDGKVPKGQVVYVPGRLLVDTVSATVGGAAQTGSQLMVGRQIAREFQVAGTLGGGGTIDQVIAAGTAVTTGTVLFRENGFPVVAIEGDAASVLSLDRDLHVGSSDGSDVKLLESMLRAGGFDPNNAMSIDDHFDASTTVAVAAWWQSLGLDAHAETVTVPAGSFVVVPSGLFAGPAAVADGTQLTHDSLVLSLTAAAREVNTTAPIGDATFALGAKIDVEFPDGSIQPGTVVAVGNVATNTSNVPGSTPSVPITIHVDQIPPSVDSFVQVPVTLRVVSDSVPGAFVVPVSALVALAEGGYALEVVDGAAADGTSLTHLIAVTPGLFTDGFVAVTGDKLSDGLTVVVPS